MLLRDFFDNVYIPRRLRGKSQNSVRLYRLCIVQFARTIGHEPKLSDLTEENLLRHLARRNSLAPATRNKELAELTAMWRLAVQQSLHTGWPEIQPENEPEREPIAWMAEEIGRLLDAATKRKGFVDCIPAWLWWNGLIRLGLDCGERITAILTSRWDWIQDDWLLVPAEARKGKTRDRRYRLGNHTLGVLSEIRSRKHDPRLIFPWPYNPTYVWKMYSEILESAGLPTTRKHKFHCLRKTTGSVAYAAGLDPQDVLDHSDRRTTQKYLDPRFQKTQQVCDVLAEYLSTPPRSKQHCDRGVG